MSNPPSRWIPVAAPVIGETEIAYVTDAVRSGWVSSIGPYLDRFERGFADFCGVRHAVAVANGTVALQLALRALGVGPGCEVIVPDLTFAATAHAVLDVGASPVLADVDPVTWCLDPVAVERALTVKTRAVIPVHLYGHPADMAGLARVTAGTDILLLEDAAEAHGAKIGDQRVGSFGVAGAFSFYGNKLMTTGEGGALTTNDDTLAARFRFLKDHGMSKERRYYHTELAFNYRMTNLQAALGCAQLEQLETFIEKKRALMGWYREALDGVPAVTLNAERAGNMSVFWMVSALLGPDASESRDAVCARLRERGVDTRPFFVPMSQLPHLRGFRQVGRDGDGCPTARRLSVQGLNLPSGTGLTRDDVSYVAHAFREVLSTS
ncbi:MAG: DegT/DnrJ/EryC1/StrS family aminotransferase [Myxococcales bacterium]|nr:DegT/DnrJ/EryC1/StrS family aminotransferase [Myxococcales bacterium]